MEKMMGIMHSRRPRGAPCALLIVAALLPQAAAAGCTAYAPGFDGVLRLDSGRGFSAPCNGPARAYAAVPPNDAAVAPSERPAKPAPKAGEPPPPAANAAPLPPPAPAPAPQVAAPASEEMALLKQQTLRLKDEVARLNDETAGLRSETRRLREVLARRDVGEPDKLGSKLAPSAAVTVAPKGDLLPAPPAVKDEARAASGEPHPADQAELERRKNVAARAWNELLDFVSRMKSLGGKTE